MLYILVPAIAMLYASVGFGGATGYLAVMSIFGLPPALIASTALMLNTLVAGMAFVSFYKAGHLRTTLLTPFLVTSVPAAFLGGYFKIPSPAYTLMLHIILAYVAARLLFFSRDTETNKPHRALPPVLALSIGLGIGLVSGMIGIGGGIFLSPIIVLFRWGTSKQAAAVSSAFIVLNSISGLAGRFAGGTFVYDFFALTIIPFGVAGALLGSHLGATKIKNLNLRRTLGLVMLFIIGTFFWRTFWQ